MKKITFVNNQSPYLNDTNLNQMQTNMANASVPIGCGMDYFGTTAPDNWLFAMGQAISRTTYSDLFAVIGTAFGSGDGSTTFNLPDKRERVSVMYKSGSTNGTSGATLGTLGAKGGEFKHTQSVNEMPPHQHDEIIITGTTVTVNSTSGSNSINLTSSGNANKTVNKLYTSKTGGGQAMNVMQPYLVCNYIIKVKE